MATAVPWLIIAYYYKDWFVNKVTFGDISLNGLFSAVFGWASIQTGFIFSVFGFVATKTGGLVEEFRSTPYIFVFESYVRRAMYLGLILTVYSIPMMSYKVDVDSPTQYWIVCIWFALFIWAFGAFLRVALNFGQLLSRNKGDDTYLPG